MAKSVILASKIDEGSYLSTTLASALFHALLFMGVIFFPKLIPYGKPVVLGTGPGGGSGGDAIPVGLADDLGGGAGQYKPALRPQPPVAEVPKSEVAKAVEKPREEKAVDLPEIAKPKKETKQTTEKFKDLPKLPPNYIPIEPKPGAGGSGRPSGSGGGFGGGVGVQIGSGSGGLGDSWYARQVERRLGENWLKSLMGTVEGRYQTVISFYINDNGTITNITLERSSGVAALDFSAQRAVEASNPLAALPYELRGRPVKFIAYFEYPPPR